MDVSSAVPFAAINLRLASSEASAAHARASRYALKTTKIALLASCTTTQPLGSQALTSLSFIAINMTTISVRAKGNGRRCRNGMHKIRKMRR